MTTELILVCLASLAAGFIDAIVGGGGLVQTPVLFLTFPHESVARVLGTTKIPSFSGTAISLYQYSKHVTFNWKLVAWIAAAAFCASLLGSRLVSLMSNETIKPVILVILIGVAIYTYTSNNFGQQEAQDIPFSTLLVRGVVSGLLLGFYDGFIGPGTGSFLILAFIGLLGNDFLHASAHAKLVNLATNLASIAYFAAAGLIMYELALPMAACNMTGGFIGSRLALLKGNKFIRVFFLLVVFGTIARFGYDVLFTSR